MENAHLKNISGLLLATFFISTSGVLGRYIAMPTEVIIWFRAAIAMVLLYLYCKYKKIDLTIKSSKDYKPFFISGLLMAVHWVTYFLCLKTIKCSFRCFIFIYLSHYYSFIRAVIFKGKI